jgi:hypothetical protein
MESSNSNSNSCLIVRGLPGVGKTIGVYACCNDLGFHVLEVNASQPRNGKHLINQVGEATQSHIMMSTNQTPETNTLLAETESSLNGSGNTSNAQLSMLLLEEVDCVFDSSAVPSLAKQHNTTTASNVGSATGLDKGFFSAVKLLMHNSKRPIILTCNGKWPQTIFLGSYAQMSTCLAS